MSIFAEYKHGLIDKDEFRQAAAREFAGDNDYLPTEPEDEGEPCTEVTPAKWHTEPPTCGGEYLVTITYHFDKNGIDLKGRLISISEYDYPVSNWIVDDYITHYKNYKVVAWAALPELYTGASEGV